MEAILVLIVLIFFIYALIDEILLYVGFFSFLAFCGYVVASNTFMAIIFFCLTLFIYMALVSYDYQVSSNYQRQQIARTRQAKNYLFVWIFVPILILGFIAYGFSGIL